MLGFIKKDLFIIKNNLKFIGIIFIVYLLMAFTNKMDVTFLLPFLSVVLMISTFSYDDFNNWNAYAVTLPKGRANIVRAKYVSTLILLVISTIIVTIISILVSLVNKMPINYSELLLMMSVTMYTTALVLVIMYPIIFKFGVEKGRIAIFILIFGIAILGGLFIDYINLSSVVKLLDKYWQIIIPVTGIGLVYLSYLISKRIVMKKEY